MRFFEWAITIYFLISFIYLFIQKQLSKKVKLVLIIILLTLLLGHMTFESLRWQMGGIYFLSLILIIKLFFPIKKQLLKILSLTLQLLIIMLTIILLILFPINQVPPLTGNYQVGTISFDLVDENRIEIYGNDDTSLRKIRVQMWYPTDDTSGTKDYWISDGKFVSEQIASFVNLPGFLSDYVSVIKSNSFINASLAKNLNQIPVIIISHGWTSMRDLHTDYAEMLASNGYLVLGIDHTYGSLGVVFDDGSEVKLNSEALLNANDKNFLSSANQLVDTYYQDDQLVVDYLDTINQEKSSFSQFANKIDIDNIGILGHSTGGGGAVKLALNNSKIKAVMGLDAWVEPLSVSTIAKNLNTPALFLRSEQWSDGPNNINLSQIVKNATSDPKVYQINGTIHQDFSMLYMFDPLGKYFGLSGTVDSDLDREIQNAFILNFFNHNLKNETFNSDDLASEYSIVDKVNFQ